MFYPRKWFCGVWFVFGIMISYDVYAEPKAGEELNITLPNDIPLTFCYIPAGEFKMGSPPEEPGREADEAVHSVKITQPFWLGKFEVLQIQWKALMGDNPVLDCDAAQRDGSTKSEEFSPVYYVSWNAAQAFLTKINQLGQGTFRLPTEAEWEYACRAGTATQYYWGNEVSEKEIDKYAWYDKNNKPIGAKIAGFKSPNTWGLHEMCGNVWEWCQDWYGPYPADDQTDPSGPASGAVHIIRGGAWYSPAVYLRSANRNWSPINEAKYFVGLRIVRTVAE